MKEFLNLNFVLTFFSNSGPFSIACMMASDNLTSNVFITSSMPLSVFTELWYNNSIDSATLDHGLSNTPTYCAKQPLKIPNKS